MKMLIFSPIVLTLSLYMAVVYGYLYLLFTTITEVYEVQYQFSAGSVGLTYLGIGVGSLIGVITFGIASDRIMKALSKGGEMKAEYRLPPMIPGSFLIPIGCMIVHRISCHFTNFLSVLVWLVSGEACLLDRTNSWYWGWLVELHPAGLVMSLTRISWTRSSCYLRKFLRLPRFPFFIADIFLQMPISTYLVDAFTTYAASALAANTVLRSLIGALLPLAGQKMYATLGYGWGNSLLAFIALAMCPLPVFLYKYGERIRKSPRFQLNL